MTPEPKWRRYLRFVRPNVAADVEDEIDFHVAQIAERLIREGTDPATAWARAHQEFGDRAGAERACREIGEASLLVSRRRRWWEDLRDDLRYGARNLRRAPGFSVVAALTLALGVGAATAIFSVVNGVLIRPLPYREPDRLVRLYEVSPKGDDKNPIAGANFLDWRARARSFAVLAIHRWPYDVVLSGIESPVRVVVDDLSPAALEALGVRPLFGRLFGANEPGATVLLSAPLWRSRFGADSSVVGRTIALGDVSHTIVGVMPDDFRFPGAGVDLWRPVTEQDLATADRRSHNWGAVGRLAPGVPFGQALAELRAITAAMRGEYPAFLEGWDARVTPLKDDLVGPIKPMLLALLGGVGLVLLIACANLANLFLARSLSREREVAVRAALGAGRGRIVRQLMTEVGVLAAIAAAIGLLLAHGLLRVLVALAPADLPRLAEVRIDPVVLGFAALVTMASALGFGLAPALASARDSSHAALRAGADRSGGLRHHRVRGAVLVAEVALSLVLLTGAGLLVRSFLEIRGVDLGYRPEPWLALTVDLPAARYPDFATQSQFADRVGSEFAAVPGVAAVTATTRQPASDGPMTFSFAIDGRPSPNPSGRFDPEPLQFVPAGHFAALGVPVLRGRSFDSRDRRDAPPVAVVSEAFAQKYWPDTDPVGRRIAFRTNQPWIEVVGVVGNVVMGPADQPAGTALYLPADQRTYGWLSWQTVLVRAQPGREPATLAAGVAAALRRIDPALPPSRLAPVTELYAESVARRRFAMILLAAFAAAAVALGLIGLYGVLAATVAQRRPEIAVRLALGASRGAVVGMVLRQAAGYTALGIGLGAIAAGWLTGLLRGMLFQVSPLDPFSFGFGALFLGVAAIGAALIPARRAAGVAPIQVLRDS